MPRKTGALALLGAFLWLSPAAAAPRDPEAELAPLDQDAAHRAILADPVKRAHDAVTRAQNLDRAGDGVHAAMLRAVALEWIDMARDALRAAEAEAQAEKMEKALDDLETKIVRGRALLEETVARRGRARSLLEELEAQSKAVAAPASVADASARPALAEKTPHAPKKGAAKKPPAAPSKKPGRAE
jgi:hypothetical protein